MPNLNTIPLSALRTIETIARTGTLAHAAEELGVTPGALSQRLAKAEESLGQTLFLRTSKGLVPTAVCAQIAPRLTQAMSDLAEIVADIAPGDETSLTVSVAPIFASRWLIWRIQRFNQQNPNISVMLVPKIEIVDLDNSEVDIGIRTGIDPAIGNGARKLLDQRVFPVCTQDIASQIHSPADLLKFPIIRENELLYGWNEWLDDVGLPHLTSQPGPTYADASLCLDAAMAGQGVFMAWETLACDAVERGQVVSPFPQRTLTGATYWFATGRYAKRKPAIDKFRIWLESELECSINFWAKNLENLSD